ncbi:MAG: NHL repeat-containing protein [Verrucomicrobiota bacterium]
MRIVRTLRLAGCLMAAGLILPTLPAQDFTFTTIAGGSQGPGDGLNLNAQFYSPTGVAVDGGGNVYVADQNNNLIRKISPLGTNWIVRTIAGGGQGSRDGTNGSAQFSNPTGIAVDISGNLYVADQYNSDIRRIALSGTNWVVTTIAGSAGLSGSQNGTNGDARFSNPSGIAVDGEGNLLVADEMNNAIRKITLSGTNWVVSTLAGGTEGDQDGTNLAARFFGPSGVAVDTSGRVFVADQFNNTIRLMTPVGTNWRVTTIAGQSVSGLSNGVGTNACFDAPLSVAVDASNNVYVADLFNNAIRRLAPSGSNWLVSTIAGGSLGSSNGTGANASFDLPFGVATDAYGDVFVADSRNNSIRLGVSAASLPPTGSLEVNIVPVSSGAEWQLDGGGPFQTNGAILTNLVPGVHTISFSLVAGLTTPAVQTVPVTAHQTTLALGTYVEAIANAGSLQVMLSPAGSLPAEAQWRVDTGAWQTNGGIVAGLSVGLHALSFNPVTGWTSPSGQTVSITNSQTTLATATYVLQTGSLQVTILPSAVAASGAKWQVDGGTLQAGGATLPGLLPGSHTVYTRPPQLAGTIAAGGKFQFVLRGPAGNRYIIQASPDLVSWTSLSTNTIPAGGSIPINDSDMTNHVRRFYRAVTVTTSPPQLVGLTANRATAQFVLNGQAGSECVIQASSDLVAWSAIFTNIIPEAGSMLISDSGATNRNHRFYRALGR